MSVSRKAQAGRLGPNPVRARLWLPGSEAHSSGLKPVTSEPARENFSLFSPTAREQALPTQNRG